MTRATATGTITDTIPRGILQRAPSMAIDEGGSRTFSVELNTQPATAVQVAVSSSNPDPASALPATLDFLTTIWYSTQTVLVTIIDDDKTVLSAPRNLQARAGDSEVVLSCQPSGMKAGTPSHRVRIHAG